MTRAAYQMPARANLFSCYPEHEQLPARLGAHPYRPHRVRCNLFHGEKARSSENDQRVVSAAYETLRAFLGESRLLG